VPFVARHARHEQGDVRRRLSLPPDRPLVLSSFGGYGLDGLDLTLLDCLDEYCVVLTRRGPPAPGVVPSAVFEIREDDLYGAGLRYEDLIAAVEVVLTKPGYGIISECVANGAAMLYTSRGRFAEYDILVSEMPRFLRCAFIDHAALFSGRWRESLDALLASPAPPERPATNGGQVIAEMMVRQLEVQ
jgi:L-arabinokinase